jgi:hypothetical protein
MAKSIMNKEILLEDGLARMDTLKFGTDDGVGDSESLEASKNDM